MDHSLAAVDSQSQQALHPQQQQPSFAYEPSQPPSYDPYYHSYYAQPQPQPQPHFDPHYPHQPYADASKYAYYSRDYAAAFPQPSAHDFPTPQPLPPGAPAPHPSAANHRHLEPETTYAMQIGINPSAAAAIKALSELSQFAERMDAQERARTGAKWHDISRGMVTYGVEGYGPQHYLPVRRSAVPPVEGNRKQRGRGRHSGGPSRGGGGIGGIESSNHNVSGSENRAPTFRGKGRGGRAGRGRGRHAAASSAGNEAASTQVSAPVSVLPPRPIIPVAWCDICRVDCNSLEILEQHKNGKRHKKTVLRLEEMQARLKLLEDLETKSNQEMLDKKKEQTNVDTKQEVSGQPHTLVVQQPDIEIAHVAPADDVATEVQQSEEGNVDKSEAVSIPSLETKPTRGGHGPSRQFRGGRARFARGGKRLSSDSSPSKPPKRPREMPHFCNICNVTCDTQAVFESHLGGKKHLSKVKQLTGRQAVLIPPIQHPGTENPPASAGYLHPSNELGGNASESSTCKVSAADGVQVMDSVDPQSAVIAAAAKQVIPSVSDGVAVD